MENTQKRCRVDGFSLIELSIVMIIIGIILSAGISVFKPGAVSVMNMKTETILKANTDALIGYAAVQQRLPIPQDYLSLVRSQKDGFGNDTTYIPASGFSELRSVCKTSFTDLAIIPRRGAARVDNVAFIIQSYGNDGEDDLERLRSTSSSGKTIYSVPPRIGGDDRALAKDDVVEWATLSEVQAAAKCGPALRITTTDLPAGTNQKNYSADIFAVGGTYFPRNGNYEWCWSGNMPKGLNLATVVERSYRTLIRSRECSINAGTWAGGDYVHITSAPIHTHTQSWKKHPHPHPHPTPEGGVENLTIFVRDNDGLDLSQHHYASETFTLTIAGGHPRGDYDERCTEYVKYFEKDVEKATQTFNEKSEEIREKFQKIYDKYHPKYQDKVDKAKENSMEYFNEAKEKYEKELYEAQKEFDKKTRGLDCPSDGQGGGGYQGGRDDREDEKKELTRRSRSDDEDDSKYKGHSGNDDDDERDGGYSDGHDLYEKKERKRRSRTD